MSLEAKIEELIAAVKENTATLKALSGKTTDAAAKGEAKSEGKTTSTKKAVKVEEEEKPKSSKGGRPPKEKVLTATEMGEKAKEFCEAAEDDEDEFKARRALVTKLAKKFDAEKFSAISDPEDQKAALAALEDYLSDNGDGDGDDDNY